MRIAMIQMNKRKSDGRKKYKQIIMRKRVRYNGMKAKKLGLQHCQNKMEKSKKWMKEWNRWRKNSNQTNKNTRLEQQNRQWREGNCSQTQHTKAQNEGKWVK